MAADRIFCSLLVILIVDLSLMHVCKNWLCIAILRGACLDVCFDGSTFLLNKISTGFDPGLRTKRLSSFLFVNK